MQVLYICSCNFTEAIRYRARVPTMRSAPMPLEVWPTPARNLAAAHRRTDNVVGIAG